MLIVGGGDEYFDFFTGQILYYDPDLSVWVEMEQSMASSRFAETVTWVPRARRLCGVCVG